MYLKGATLAAVYFLGLASATCYGSGAKAHKEIRDNIKKNIPEICKRLVRTYNLGERKYYCYNSGMTNKGVDMGAHKYDFPDGNRYDIYVLYTTNTHTGDTRKANERGLTQRDCVSGLMKEAGCERGGSTMYENWDFTVDYQSGKCKKEGTSDGKVFRRGIQSNETEAIE